MAKGLPNGWTSTTLGEIVQPTRPRVQPADFPSLPFVGLEHIESDTMRLVGSGSPRDISSSCTKFETGDVLYARMRPKLNKVWVADQSGLCSTEFIVLPRSPDLDSNFLGYRLNAIDFAGFAAQQTTGDRPRVSFAQISTFEINLPPLAEQKRIVAKLEAKLDHVRKGEASLHRAKERLSLYRQSVVAAAVTGRLRLKAAPAKAQADEPGATATDRLAELIQMRASRIAQGRAQSSGTELFAESNVRPPVQPDTSNSPPIPSKWKWVSIDQLSWDSGYGTSTRCTPNGAGPPVLRIPNVQHGEIDKSNLKFAVEENALRDDDLVAPGDLLVIRTNGSRELLGRAAMVFDNGDTRIGFASYLIRFRVTGDADMWRWITLAWNSHALRPVLYLMASTTAGQYNVSLSNLKTFAIPLPPASVQRGILLEVANRLASGDRLSANIEHQLNKAREQRRSVINDAFTGSFVNQIAEEEPASVLLERLKGGREITARAIKAGKHKPKKDDEKGSPRTANVLKPLLDTLKASGNAMAPEDLFSATGFLAAFRKSNFDHTIIDKFYDELRELMLLTPGIREQRPDQNTVLLEHTP
ncbi:MAG TPA: restriction endonuclease subunit S [Tepidisphaeraceae bacterium]|nr:restriction endonuclease subunit S [Tepidisphaeraceae bacterium]